MEDLEYEPRDLIEQLDEHLRERPTKNRCDDYCDHERQLFGECIPHGRAYWMPEMLRGD